MIYFSRRNQIASFLLMLLLIAPTFSFVATADDALRINSKIAFTSEGNDNREIYKMNDDGSGQTKLSKKNNYYDEWCCWSTNGIKIAFSSNRDCNVEIYVMRACLVQNSFLLDLSKDYYSCCRIFTSGIICMV